MGEFGHSYMKVPGFGMADAWGWGPFVIEAGGKEFRFEDSDRFGPSLIRLNGELRTNPYPSPKSPFWRAHRLWVKQGRRLDGILCLWDEPEPNIIRKVGKRSAVLVKAGDEDGKYIEAPNPIRTEG